MPLNPNYSRCVIDTTQPESDLQCMHRPSHSETALPVVSVRLHVWAVLDWLAVWHTWIHGWMVVGGCKAETAVTYM